MTDSAPQIETRLSDRDVLLHVLGHVEHIDEQVTRIVDELETFAPLIAKYRPAGGADMLTMIQAARELRRGANGRQRS